MKNSKIAVLSILGALTIQNSTAEACSYYINEVQKRNELIAAAASHKNLELTDVKKVAIADFQWFESKPTPMCPEELTYVATVSLKYVDNTATFPRSCTTNLKATKIENWKTNQVDFILENDQTVCKDR